MAEFEQVTPEVFELFVSGYPRPLTPDHTAICEPPMTGFYDFDAAKGADALVAAFHQEYGVGEGNHRISLHLLDDGQRQGFAECRDRIGVLANR